MTELQQLPLTLASEEVSILRELLESEQSRLPVEIRHTDHRGYRDLLRQRLATIEHLLVRLPTA